MFNVKHLGCKSAKGGSPPLVMDDDVSSVPHGSYGHVSLYDFDVHVTIVKRMLRLKIED